MNLPGFLAIFIVWNRWYIHINHLFEINRLNAWYLLNNVLKHHLWRSVRFTFDLIFLEVSSFIGFVFYWFDLFEFNYLRQCDHFLAAATIAKQVNEKGVICLTNWYSFIVLNIEILIYMWTV